MVYWTPNSDSAFTESYLFSNPTTSTDSSLWLSPWKKKCARDFLKNAINSPSWLSDFCKHSATIPPQQHMISALIKKTIEEKFNCKWAIDVNEHELECGTCAFNWATCRLSLGKRPIKEGSTFVKGIQKASTSEWVSSQTGHEFEWKATTEQKNKWEETKKLNYGEATRYRNELTAIFANTRNVMRWNQISERSKLESFQVLDEGLIVKY